MGSGGGGECGWSVGEGRLDAGEGGFILFLGGVFGSGKKKFSGGVFRESHHLRDMGTYLVDRVAEIGDMTRLQCGAGNGERCGG